MAERRMMSKSVIETDAFMDMPFSTQALYFHLLLRADDDGFIKSPKAIMRFINARDDDMKLLIAKQYVLAFDSGVIVIKHWKIHNYIRSDRYKKTDCIEAQQVKLTGDNEYTIRQNGMSVGTPSGIPDGRQVVAEAVDEMDTQVRLGKVRLGKDSIELDSIGDKSPKTPAKPPKKRAFIPPTLEEVNDYILERGIHNVSAKAFFDYYEAGDWHDAKGNKVKSWKQKLLTWARHEDSEVKPSQNLTRSQQINQNVENAKQKLQQIHSWEEDLENV